MKNIIIALVLVFVTNLSYGYGNVLSTIKSVRVDRGGIGIIEFSSPVVHQPATCRVAPYTSHLSFNANTSGGKAIYSMALTAIASGKTVNAIGTGECSEYVNIVESMSYAVILEN